MVSRTCRGCISCYFFGSVAVWLQEPLSVVSVTWTIILFFFRESPENKAFEETLFRTLKFQVYFCALLKDSLHENFESCRVLLYGDWIEWECFSRFFGKQMSFVIASRNNGYNQDTLNCDCPSARQRTQNLEIWVSTNFIHNPVQLSLSLPPSVHNSLFAIALGISQRSCQITCGPDGSLPI